MTTITSTPEKKSDSKDFLGFINLREEPAAVQRAKSTYHWFITKYQESAEFRDLMSRDKDGMFGWDQPDADTDPLSHAKSIWDLTTPSERTELEDMCYGRTKTGCGDIGQPTPKYTPENAPNTLLWFMRKYELSPEFRNKIASPVLEGGFEWSKPASVVNLKEYAKNLWKKATGSERGKLKLMRETLGEDQHDSRIPPAKSTLEKKEDKKYLLALSEDELGVAALAKDTRSWFAYMYVTSPSFREILERDRKFVWTRNRTRLVVAHAAFLWNHASEAERAELETMRQSAQQVSVKTEPSTQSPNLGLSPDTNAQSCPAIDVGAPQLFGPTHGLIFAAPNGVMEYWVTFTRGDALNFRIMNVKSSRDSSGVDSWIRGLLGDIRTDFPDEIEEVCWRPSTKPARDGDYVRLKNFLASYVMGLP